ncbi:MAG: PEGA domain-containing protein, partial [Myxococcaceae bacterium]
QRLFKGESDMHTLRLVKDCLVPKPSSLNPEVPPAIDEVVLKALAPKAQDRYRDAAEFRLAIENLLISHSIPASSAHLSAWMQQIYAERIEREADPAVLDELAPSANIEPGSTPVSRPSNSLPAVSAPKVDGKSVSGRSKNQASVDSALPTNESRHETIALTAPGSRSFGKIAAIAGAAVALIAIGIAVPLMLRKPPEEPKKDPIAIVQPPPAKKDPIIVETPHNDPPPEVKDVLVQLRSDPAGASVNIGGRLLGVTPLDVAVPGDGARVLAKLSLDGFEAHEAMLSKADGPALVVQLKKHAVAKKNPPPNLGIKTGR